MENGKANYENKKDKNGSPLSYRAHDPCAAIFFLNIYEFFWSNRRHFAIFPSHTQTDTHTIYVRSELKTICKHPRPPLFLPVALCWGCRLPIHRAHIRSPALSVRCARTPIFFFLLYFLIKPHIFALSENNTCNFATYEYGWSTQVYGRQAI